MRWLKIIKETECDYKDKLRSIKLAGLLREVFCLSVCPEILIEMLILRQRQDQERDQNRPRPKPGQDQDEEVNQDLHHAKNRHQDKNTMTKTKLRPGQKLRPDKKNERT